VVVVVVVVVTIVGLLLEPFALQAISMSSCVRFEYMLQILKYLCNQN
jgi:hypothetical protein